MGNFYIMMKRNQRSELSSRGFSESSISDALNFRRSSLRSLRIRNLALNVLGGILLKF